MTRIYFGLLLSFSLLGCASVESGTTLYYSTIDHAAGLTSQLQKQSGAIEIADGSESRVSSYQRISELPGYMSSVYKIMSVREVSKSASVVAENSYLKLIRINVEGATHSPNEVTLFYDKHGVNFSGYGKKPQVGQQLELIFSDKGQLAWVEPLAK